MIVGLFRQLAVLTTLEWKNGQDLAPISHKLVDNLIENCMKNGYNYAIICKILSVLHTSL